MSTKQIEALKLADALLWGANMDAVVVERIERERTAWRYNRYKDRTENQ